MLGNKVLTRDRMIDFMRGHGASDEDVEEVTMDFDAGEPVPAAMFFLLFCATDGHASELTQDEYDDVLNLAQWVDSEFNGGYRYTPHVKEARSAKK